MESPIDENILIVDDDETIVYILKTILKDKGNIDVGYNGQDGLDLLKQKYYKVIITDIQMPVMDGITFFFKSTAIFPTTKSRFIFITGSLSPRNLVFLEKFDIKYMLKPMEMEVLKNEVDQVLFS